MIAVDPGVAEAVRTALRTALPARAAIFDDDILASYSSDRATFCPAGRPLALVFPQTTEHVSTTLRIASEHDIPVVPQGARSGLAGGANAIDGCILVNTARLNQIVDVNAANRYLTTQPGALTIDVARAAGDVGLHYPPDPGSWEFCTIGGNLATNAGGMCCLKYGVTADHVLALEVVLASGEVLRTGRRTMKGVAGYDLMRLLVGSEGTLGIITEATLSLVPRPPAAETVAATFSNSRLAAEAVAAVLRCPTTPSMLEFIDQTSLRALDDAFGFGYGEQVGALLLIQSDAGGEAGRSQIESFAAALHGAGASDVIIADDPAEADLLLQARRQVIPALERLGALLIDDVCVPRDLLGDLISGVGAIAEQQRLTIGVVGHAGDGNFHPTVVFDRHDQDQVRRGRTAFADIMTLGLSLGGTITGEHGVGVLKTAQLRQEIDDVALRVQRDLKRTLDPRNILNPGKVFDD